MEPTRLLVAYLLLLLAGLSVLLVVHGKNETTNVLAENQSITEEQRRVHQECRNPDYKQYVKCLMRPKRHHGPEASRGDMQSEPDITCMTTCLSKCDHHVEYDCEKKCSHCTKRIRYRHQFITEIDKECEFGKCVPSSNGGELKTTNVTTNIDIKNVINTDNTSGIHPPWYPPSLPIIPQISLVPQITYGIGCAYSHWFCFQQTGVQIPGKPDCSACGNPVLRYKCDITCNVTSTNATTRP